MKLLVASDIHCSRKYSESLVEKSEEADIVIIAGDLASVRRGLSKTISYLRGIIKPVLLVPGNNETFDELEEACKGWYSALVLHSTGITIEGEHFYGIGGGIPITPFGSWSYDFSEEEAREMLQDCPDQVVLISHSPPKGILDKSSSGINLGSEAVRETIEIKKPKLVVCGHIHESGGRKETFGETLVINAGPEGMLVELNSDL